MLHVHERKVQQEVKDGDRSGWMTLPVTGVRLTLANVSTMDGGAMTVLTHKTPVLSAIKVTGKRGGSFYNQTQLCVLKLF